MNIEISVYLTGETAVGEIVRQHGCGGIAFPFP